MSSSRVVVRPHEVHNRFEFAIMAALRAHQLQRGALPRAAPGHKAIVIAQEEIWSGVVTRIARED
jgi:DNA-directed RNA polymerase subunit K/omega